jgi:putative polyketide hydroxylase
MYDDDKTQVLVVVGGALIGLSSAVFLAAHGVPCVVVERRLDRLIYILSAVRGINPRAVELFRQVGLEPAIRGRQKLCEQSDQYAFAPIHAETLADEE